MKNNSRGNNSMATEEKGIAEYSVTTAELAKLKVGLTGKIYAVENATGMALAKFDRRGLVTLRTDLEKKRVEIKAPALERCKLIDSEANRIKAELLALEAPIDEQIKAEENRKEAEKAEKARIAAEAQKVLDDKIIEIGKLPLKFIGLDSTEISRNLAVLEARPFGAEFSGDTLARAEASKTEAVQAIRDMLAATVKAEELAVILKAEQEAEAARLETERIEREAVEKLQREAMAAQQAELDEQKRLQGIESARLAELAKVEQKRLDDERATFEAEKAEVAKKQAEDDRRAAAAAAELKNQAEALAEVEAAKQREIERVAADNAEMLRKKAEADRKVAERALKLEKAKCASATDALKKILGIAQDNSRNETQALAEIAVLAEANI